MHSSRLALTAALLALPMLSRAQSPVTEPASTPKFYVGLGAFHSNYQNLASWRQGDTGFRVPVQLIAGYQLRPGLALELGVAYSGRTFRHTYKDYYYNTAGTEFYSQYSSTSTERVTSVSALACYALTRQPAHRLQVEALGGFALMNQNFQSQTSVSDDFSGTLLTRRSSYRGSVNDLLLTAGAGLRYRLSPRFGLNFDIATNYSLTTPRVYGNGFTGSAALGLRYRFGN